MEGLLGGAPYYDGPYLSYVADCGVCSSREEEPVLHAIKDCSLVQDVWKVSKFEALATLKCRTLVDWWDLCFDF